MFDFSIIVNGGQFFDMIDKQLFGRQLRQLRQQQGISQSELARVLGVGRSTVSEVESGKHFPPAEAVVWFLKELNTSPQEWTKYGIAVEGQRESLSGARAGAGMVAESPLDRSESEAVQRLLRLLHAGDKRVRRHLLHQLRLLEEAASILIRTTTKQ